MVANSKRFIIDEVHCACRLNDPMYGTVPVVYENAATKQCSLSLVAVPRSTLFMRRELCYFINNKNR